MDRKTALYEAHQALGAKMVPFGGFLMPIQYSGIRAEHMACREQAAVFDTCHMGQFVIRDGHAIEDLDRLLTCHVADLAVGACRYGLMCNEQGGVVDDLLVYRLAKRECMLVVNAATQTRDFEWVTTHLSRDTHAEDVSDRTAKVDLQGPAAPAIMARLAAEPIAHLRYFTFMPNACANSRVLISRTGYTGEIGFEIYGDTAMARQLWAECLDLGAVPAGLGARDTLRLEAGLPLYGHELDEHRNAVESGFTKAIAADKDFVGARMVLDPARRKSVLVGIALGGRQAARAGDILRDEQGHDIGAITSGSFAPSLGIAVAMGYVGQECSRQGSRVNIQTARQVLAGTVVRMPFYRRGSARMRMG